jgi:hypothetical protein
MLRPIVLIAALLLAGVPTSSGAQAGTEIRVQASKPLDVAAGLGLTDEQWSLYAAIEKDVGEKRRAVLAGQSRDAKPTQAQLDALATITAEQAKAIRAIMTAEQFARFEENIAARFQAARKPAWVKDGGA